MGLPIISTLFSTAPFRLSGELLLRSAVDLAAHALFRQFPRQCPAPLVVDHEKELVSELAPGAGLRSLDLESWQRCVEKAAIFLCR